jgi:uncharacterized protein YbjT (DUF2867 family)
VEGDCLEKASLLSAMQGISTAYYLVHSMGSSGDFEEQDRQAARNFAEAARERAEAARERGVKRIIYLGGLFDEDHALSPHLKSRQEVGDILRASGVPVIELRASIVIGSGSFSFELIRALVERLPVMICPKWVSTPAQPIAIEDLLAYLMEALEIPARESRVYEIGGADRVSYADIMREYARQRGLRRLMISVPVLTPRLSSLWLGLVTPVYTRIGRKLIDSLQNPTVVKDKRARSDFRVRPRGLKEAIERALLNEDAEMAETRWSDALSSGQPPRNWTGVRFGTRIIDSRVAKSPHPPAKAFAPVRRIGGSTGWYYANALWHFRGFLDLMGGGVGMRRGRRSMDSLQVGDTVDFWRVEAFEPDRRLRLAAEMKLPGRAWLEFEIEGDPSGSRIRQTAIFDPVGLLGRLYWCSLYPLHRLIFAGMLRRIVDEGQRS